MHVQNKCTISYIGGMLLGFPLALAVSNSCATQWCSRATRRTFGGVTFCHPITCLGRISLRAASGQGGVSGLRCALRLALGLESQERSQSKSREGNGSQGAESWKAAPESRGEPRLPRATLVRPRARGGWRRAQDAARFLAPAPSVEQVPPLLGGALPHVSLEPRLRGDVRRREIGPDPGVHVW